MSSAKTVYQAISSEFFFRTTYGIGQSTWKTTSLLLHQLQTELGPWWYCGTSLPFRDTRPSPLDLKAAVVWPCSFTEVQSECNFPLLQPVSLPKQSASGVTQVYQKKERRKLKEAAELPQHSCDVLAFMKGYAMWRTPNIFGLILKLPGFPCLIADLFCLF